MEDDIGEMVRSLYGPAVGAASIEGPSISPAAATPSEAADKVIVPDITMTENTTDDMAGGEQTDMGVTHFQCMAARAAKCQIEATSIAADATFGKTIKLDAEQIGSLNPKGEKEVDKTFRGARVKRGGDTVNQSATMTIDPSNMYCIGCDIEHPVVQNQGKPVVMVLCDQNFVPVWPNTTKDSCVVIVRLSNPDLHELFDLLFELLDRTMLPDGSMVLASSVSYLHRVGTSYYAREWTQVVNKMGRRMPNVRVCPLPPLIRSNCSGGVARELIELGGWFASVYKNSPQGLLEAWNSLATITIERSAGQTTLNAVEAYTISLPSSLELGAPDKPSTLYTNSSRPSVLFGIDQGTVGGLLHTISIVLDRDFKISVGAGLKPASTRAADGVQEHVKRVVLVGASNLKRVIGDLQREGYEVIDLCTPGWTVTPQNVQKLGQILKNSNLSQNSAFIFDLFGNSCFRATLFDGSTVMPMKEGGGYHLPGNVEVCKDDIFGKLIDIVQPVLDCAESSVRVVIPPQPRYLYSPCCSDRSHCCNVGLESHAETLLAGCFRLRSILKRKLTASGSVAPPWVMDSCCCVPNAPGCTVTEKLVVLKRVSAKDGVHFSPEGNTNVAKNICETLSLLQTGTLGKRDVLSRSAAVAISGTEPRHFWKGFSSPVGSVKKTSNQSWGKFPKDRSHGNNVPYKRWGRGGKSFWKN
jgi:hypothetical protein